MTGSPAALIFDMDGVLINSEPLWRKAMMVGFKEYGMDLTEQDCRSTMGMRFREVIAYWLARYNFSHLDPVTIEDRVHDLLIDLIGEQGAMLPGVKEIIDFCRTTGVPMGIATSSAQKLLDTVVKKLDLELTIPFRVSAEQLTYAKPHPEVFLLCARRMGVPPENCLVIEDSVNGVIAARAAGMRVIAVPDTEQFDLPQFVIAHYFFRTMSEVPPLLKQLFSHYTPQRT